MALPDIGPAVAAGVLASPALEAVRLPARVGVGQLGFIQQLARVEEVLLRCRPLRQRGGPPLGDELVRRHGRDRGSPSVPPPATGNRCRLPRRAPRLVVVQVAALGRWPWRVGRDGDHNPVGELPPQASRHLPAYWTVGWRCPQHPHSCPSVVYTSGCCVNVVHLAQVTLAGWPRSPTRSKLRANRRHRFLSMRSSTLPSQPDQSDTNLLLHNRLQDFVCYTRPSPRTAKPSSTAAERRAGNGRKPT